MNRFTTPLGRSVVLPAHEVLYALFCAALTIIAMLTLGGLTINKINELQREEFRERKARPTVTRVDNDIQRELTFLQKVYSTGYCPCKICCEKYSKHKKTSTGTSAFSQGVAVDKTIIPYGSVLDIPGLGPRTADDTGYAMRKAAEEGFAQVDVRFRTHKEAKQWGVKELTVEVTLPQPKPLTPALFQ